MLAVCYIGNPHVLTKLHMRDKGRRRVGTWGGGEIRRDCVLSLFSSLVLRWDHARFVTSKKNLNASRPSEHPPVGGETSKHLGGIVGCKDKTSSHQVCVLFSIETKN